MMIFKKYLFLVVLLSILNLSKAQTDSLEQWLSNSTIAFNNGHYEASLVGLQKVLAVEPDNIKALEYSIHNYYKLKNYGVAVEYGDRLIRLSPKNANYWNSTGWFLLLDKKYARAEKYCLKALKYNSCNYSIYLNLGYIYAYLKQPRKLQEYFHRAMNYIPNAEAFEESMMADLNFFEQQGDYPYKLSTLKYSFTDYLNNQYSNKKFGNEILDSIYQFTIAGDYEATDEVIIRLKEKFIVEDQKNQSLRLYTLRDFYWDLGWIYYNTGSKTIAINDYFMNALSISKDLNDTAFIIDVLYELGNSEKEGMFLMRQALDLAVLAHNFDKQFIINYSMGNKYLDLSETDSALFYFKRSFILANQCSLTDAKSLSTGKLMVIFGDKKELDSVEYYYRLGKKLNAEKHPQPVDEFFDDYNYCQFLNSIGKYKECISMSRLFITNYENYADIDISNLLEITGMSYYGLKQTDSAEYYLNRAIEHYLNYVKNNSELLYKPLTDIYPAFALLEKMALMKTKNDELFKLTEESRANAFFPKLTKTCCPLETISIKKLSSELKSDEVAITFSKSSLSGLAFGLAISHDTVMLVKEDHALLNKLLKNHEELNIDSLANQLNMAMQQVEKILTTEEIKTSSKLLFIIATNLNNLMQHGNVRGASIIEPERKRDTKAEMAAFNEILYYIYIKPFEKILQNKKTIYISGDYGSILIPFETLKNEKGEYLGSLYNIVYEPSFTVFHLLKAKSKTNHGRMLALGNAAYSKFNPHNSKGRGYDFAEDGYANWGDLPGTKNELSAIRNLLPEVVILDEDRLSESRLKELSDSNKLMDYDILHFAVHGMVSLNNYRDNSLVLTEKAGNKEDGFLLFNEIANLHLNAGLVCLSACETAAGLPDQSQEVNNLPVAFFLAGANAVIASWWKVDDKATGIFMSDFYKSVFNDKKSYSEALHITRQHFIAGVFGETYKQPYYWAAFRYFGY